VPSPKGSDTAKLHEDVGYMRGKLDELANTLVHHVQAEEALFQAHDSRLRSVERKVHTTWYIGGGAVAAAGAFVAHLLGWGK
jgi:ketosteroid isomerase-like protein